MSAEPVSLLPKDACVACFHDAHPDVPCTARDAIEAGPLPYPCGCREYVTEEERGRIVVRWTDSPKETM